jgi:ubiquinone/menaquinone biosynthesis C-methylase UbiE
MVASVTYIAVTENRKKMKISFSKRLFAWILQKGDNINYRIYHSVKEELFKDIVGKVVEVGPGAGVNFNYLPEGINWIGIEPNPAFHEWLISRTKEKNIHALVLSNSADRITLPDNSADTVICTLVLCSVHDPSKVIAEMKRILKPGGKLLFVEHVAARQGTGLRFAQNISNPINRAIADGCNCNRETWRYIEQAEFKELRLSHQRIKGTMKIHAPHIIGYAVK